MALQTIWGLKRELVEDIKKTFDDAASIYRHLSTHNKYWAGKIVQRVGVKHNIASGIAQRYLRLLKSVHENTFTGKGVDLERARNLYKKYQTYVVSDDAEPFVEDLRQRPPRNGDPEK